MDINIEKLKEVWEDIPDITYDHLLSDIVWAITRDICVYCSIPRPRVICERCGEVRIW